MLEQESTTANPAKLVKVRSLLKIITTEEDCEKEVIVGRLTSCMLQFSRIDSFVNNNKMFVCGGTFILKIDVEATLGGLDGCISYSFFSHLEKKSSSGLRLQRVPDKRRVSCAFLQLLTHFVSSFFSVA